MNWPIKDIQRGTFPWFLKEVANAMGLPPDPAALNHSQRARVESVIEEAVNIGYHPPPAEYTIPEATDAQRERLRRAPHAWSFLTNVATINVKAGKAEYPLPSNFADFLGSPTTSRANGKLDVVANPDDIRQHLDSSDATGAPLYVAREVLPGNGTQPTRNQLIVYPMPEAEEVLRVQHSIVPPTFDEEHPYLLCGDEHIETFRACCLAVIEERSGEGKIDFRERMMSRLAASIMRDQQTAVATTDGVWPDDEDVMVGPNRAYIEREIGRYAGFGPSSRSWTDSERRQVQEWFEAMKRRVFNPPIISGESYPHQWSFLSPIATLTLVSGQSVYELPADFASLEGPIQYASQQSVWHHPIQVVGEHQIRQMQQIETTSTYPEYAAVRARTYDDDIGTRWEVEFWPPPDSGYVLTYKYRVSPEVLVS